MRCDRCPLSTEEIYNKMPLCRPCMDDVKKYRLQNKDRRRAEAAKAAAKRK